MAKPPIIGLLQSRLRKTLNDNSISVGEFEAGTGKYSIVSCRSFKHFIDEETKYNIGLFPLRVADNYDYWISISLDIDFVLGKPKHLSITFYHYDIYKLFRAEWANNESSITHAQPHWHIHSKKQDLSSPLWDPKMVEAFPEDVKEIVGDNTKDIHFAMTATWQDNFHHAKSFAESPNKEILNWTDNVLKYSIQQLTYLHDKTKVHSIV